ncbi:hypothetical protein FB385_1169 [Paramicrobacterium agarici]|nr:hypothetical protein FB385_1169 [Microbacterium agarici]
MIIAMTRSDQGAAGFVLGDRMARLSHGAA